MNSNGHPEPPVRRTARAAVFHGPGRPLEIRDFTVPNLQAGEALVEITCTTICGSDLHTIRGARPVAGPTVLGHEILGRVTELPAGGAPPADVEGNRLAIGDRVTWSVAASCGNCFFCLRALPQKCEKLFKYGHETTDRGAFSGGLAELCHLVAGTAIVRVPDTLADHVACPANCATATVAGAIRIAGGCREKSVLIQGAGMLGLTTAAMAAMQGATAIVVTDLSEQRLDRASDFGATHTVQVGGADAALSEVVRHVTGGRGVDLAFEMSGSPAAVEQSVELLRTGGHLVLVGSVFPTRAARLPPEQIVRKLLRIDGLHNYTPTDLAEAIEFLKTASKRFPFESLVGAQITLDQLNAHIARSSDADPIRVAVRAQ